MPGLFGFVRIKGQSRCSRDAVQDLIGGMSSRLRHIEAYSQQTIFEKDSSFALGFIGLPNHRFANLRLKSNETSFECFYYGTVSNFEDDRRGREFISLYENGPVQALRSLRGPFAIVLRHMATGSTVIAVDRYASNPTFYCVVGDFLFFAPEIKALLTVPKLRKEIDLGTFGAFLHSGYSYDDRTLFTSIRRLKGGHHLSISDQMLRIDRYWKFRPGARCVDISTVELRMELRERIDSAVSRSLRSPDKCIIFLSGGIDSRAILGSALNAVSQNGKTLNTVSWGAHRDRPYSDVVVARAIAAELELNHREVQREISDYSRRFEKMNYITDGLSDMAAFHPHEMEVMETLYSEGFRTALRGDHVFVNREPTSSFENALTQIEIGRVRDVPLLDKIIRRDVYQNITDASDDLIDTILSKRETDDVNQFKEQLYFDTRLQCWLNNAACFKQIYFDHCNPLLDDGVLDLLETVPLVQRQNKTLLRDTVRDCYGKLGVYSYARNSNLEDSSELLTNDTSVRDYAISQFGDHQSELWDYLDRNAVNQIFKALKSRNKNTVRQSAQKKMKQRVFKVFPRAATKFSLQRSRRRPASEDKLLIRLLSLKHTIDVLY